MTKGIDLTKHHEDVRRLVFKFYGKTIRHNGWEPEDILQRVYEAILVRNRGTCPYDPAKGSMSKYILTVARCVILNFYRTQERKRIDMTDEEPTCSQPDNLSPQEFIRSLSDIEREILKGLSHGQTQISMARTRGVDVDVVGREVRALREEWHSYARGLPVVSASHTA